MEVNVVFLVILENATMVLVLWSLEDLLRDCLADVVKQQRFFQAVIVQLTHSDKSY